jgi:hypothetical protein
MISDEESYRQSGYKMSDGTVTADVDVKDRFPFLHSGDAVDMAYGLNWKWCPQKNEYYQMVNGEKKYYSDLSNGSGCYGSALKTDDAQCQRFINCLSTGDSASLSKCMDVLVDADMFEVAKDDYKNVHPDFVKRVLGRFGFKKYKESKKVISYNKWFSSELNGDDKQAVREAIKNNPKLQSYLKALVHIYNSNLVNGNTSGGVTEYANRLGKKKFRVVVGSDEDRRTTIADDLRRALYPSVVGNPNATIDALYNGALGNASFVSQPIGSMPVPIMTGGSSGISSQCMKDTGLCTSKYQALFYNIEAGLKDVNLKLSGDDSAIIKQALEKLEENEKTLEELMKILKVLVEVGRGYGITMTDEDSVKEIIPLSEFDNIEDMKVYFKAYVKNMTEKIKEQNKKTQQDVSRLFNTVLPNVLVGTSGRAGIVQNYVGGDDDELVSISVQ